MKNIKIGLITGVAMLSVFTSCKKLDLFPVDRIEKTQSFKTVADAKAWNVGLYSSLRARSAGAYLISQEVQADQLNASLEYGNRNGGPHRWDFLADDGAFSTPWSGYYSSIANVNSAIEGFAAITPTNATETADFNRYKADNYLARAYYYHQLVLRFAKAYNPATAATDLGVPVLTKFDVTAEPARNTVKQVYDQIIADINTAKPLLTSVAGVQGSSKFTIDVLTALEARVKLSMQDWAGAYTAANTLIAANKYPLTTTAAAFKALWHTDGKQEAIMQVFVSNPNELLGSTYGTILLGYNAGNQRFTPDFIPSQWVIDKFDAADIRKATYFEAKPVTIQGLNYTLTLVNKYPGNPALFTGNTNYQHAPKLFTIGEMYLIAAEAAFRQPNEGNALAALNALRTARGLTAVSSTGAALLQDIKDERFRELAFDGSRLWDLKRWGEGITRSNPQNINTINVGPLFNTFTTPATNPKFVWAIPTREVTTNPNAVQNPGW